MRLGQTLLQATSRTGLIQACPICSQLDTLALESIAQIATQQDYPKGKFLAHEGDASLGFFLILSGKVRVFKSASTGKEKVLLLAERGMTFGEDSLFGQGVFLECAQAMTDVQALLIPRDEFLKLLKGNSDLTFQVMESLCGWIKKLSHSVEDTVFLSARDKVTQYLIQLNQKSKNESFLLPAKKKEIADQLGITPETFSRVLHQLSEQKLIRLDKRKVTLIALSLKS